MLGVFLTLGGSLTNHGHGMEKLLSFHAGDDSANSLPPPASSRAPPVRLFYASILLRLCAGPKPNPDSQHPLIFTRRNIYIYIYTKYLHHGLSFPTLQAHPSTTKQQRKELWGLIHTSKLSSEAALHSAQNERLPVRAAIQVLVSEQARLSRGGGERAIGSFSGPRSPVIGAAIIDDGIGPCRVPSKREVASNELRRLRQDVDRLQLQCRAMQGQIDGLGSERRKKGGGFFRWSSFFGGGGSPDIIEKVEAYEDGSERRRPAVDVKKDGLVHVRATPPNKWRNSMS